MARWAHNKLPSSVRRQYFQLVRCGLKGAAAARRVGVSTSCGSLWFIDSGSMAPPDISISPVSCPKTTASPLLTAWPPAGGERDRRFDRQEFPDVYREISRNQKPDGRYQPWFAHNQAIVRRRRSKAFCVTEGGRLHAVISEKLAVKWSPAQISRYLRRTFPDDIEMRCSPEAIYQAIYAGRLGLQDGKLRTGRRCRKRQRRGVHQPPDQEDPICHRTAPRSA